MSRQLGYYYRKGRAARSAKRKACKAQCKAQCKAESSVKQLTTSHIPPSPLLQQAHLQAQAGLKLRLHRFYYSIAILNAVSEDRLRALRRNDQLRNVTQWLGAGFRITQGARSRVLEIEGLELLSDYGLPVALLEAQALSMAQNACMMIARSYGLLLAKEGYTPPRLTEIELNAIQMTERLKEIEKKGVVPLYEDAEGYRIWIDWSYGIGGMESNGPVYLQRISDFAKDMAEHDGWQEMKGNLSQTIGLVKYYAENMESHAKLVKQAAKLIRELRRERRMARKASQDRGQRRLGAL